MGNINVSDVEYQSHSASSLLVRIYQPSGRGPFPSLVSVHGGAWTGNDRTSNQVLDIALAQQGIVVAAIDFRLAPAAPYPASIADINLAVRWLKHHASQYATRPEFVGGIGTSSGGHQLLLSALRPDDHRYRELSLQGNPAYEAELATMVLCWPIVDPADRYKMANARGAEDMMRSQEAYFESETTMDEADPLRCLERGERLHLPPTLIVDGTADDRLTRGSISRFVSAYERAGGDVHREQFEGQGHTFIVKDPTSAPSIEAIDVIGTFVRDRTRDIINRSGPFEPARQSRDSGGCGRRRSSEAERT